MPRSWEGGSISPSAPADADPGAVVDGPGPAEADRVALRPGGRRRRHRRSRMSPLPPRLLGGTPSPELPHRHHEAIPPRRPAIPRGTTERITQPTGQAPARKYRQVDGGGGGRGEWGARAPARLGGRRRAESGLGQRGGEVGLPGRGRRGHRPAHRPPRPGSRSRRAARRGSGAACSTSAAGGPAVQHRRRRAGRPASGPRRPGPPPGRSPESPLVPATSPAGARWAARAARPSRSGDRTAPGGIPSVSAISA